MHFYFSATEIECWLLFSKKVQILKTEHKYGQYCTPLGQSDCRYFFVLAIRFKYFCNVFFKYFCNVFIVDLEYAFSWFESELRGEVPDQF